MSARISSLTEVARIFLTTLPSEERPSYQGELNKFVWWFGSDRQLGELTARTLETYQEQVETSGADPLRRLTPLKSFLTYAYQEGFLPANLAKYIRVKRRTSPKEKTVNRVQAQEEETTHLTAEGYAKLKEELEYLINEVRPQIAQELWEARLDKDIRENAPYDAAKQHQAYVEARIRELERILGSATILEENKGTSGRIRIGATVILRDLTYYEEEVRYTLVSPNETDPSAGKISIASPLGKALLDHTEGETVEISVPAGLLRYRIEKIEG
ncbi:MAG: transcription elongation factor GreA [Chloroflexi bacterium]|nr:transcription elongation factor GreA [Chloroflexota bacterium]MCL5076054.1 transcription elongation factor GreA [Chloroflexota bacterium]